MINQLLKEMKKNILKLKNDINARKNKLCPFSILDQNVIITLWLKKEKKGNSELKNVLTSTKNNGDLS